LAFAVPAAYPIANRSFSRGSVDSEPRVERAVYRAKDIAPSRVTYSEIMGRILAAILFMGVTLAQSADDLANHRKQILAWQKHREEGLRSTTGWLTLAGLFWLKPGENTIGSGGTSDFLLPRDAPSQAGVFRLSGRQVTFTNLSGTAVTLNGQPVNGTVTLKHDDDDEKCDKLEAGPVQFYVIDRDKQLAVRVKDRNSEALKTFKGAEFFPINPAFRFDAKFIEQPENVPVPNVMGETDMEKSPGLVEFSYQGQTYRMRALYEGKTLFFVFRDLTSKKETYQGGRMLNTPLPENGKVVLDFNRAYNPPCTFTPFATCPRPLKENVLPIRIEAGELRYAGYSH
jgi:uncharacterized protein (DUF1684 family)